MRVNASALYSGLLSDLASYIDVQLPSWAPDSNAFHVACYQMRDSFMKKFMERDDPSPKACENALKKFLAINKRCGEWSMPLEFSQDEMLLGGLKDTLHHFWFRPDGAIVSDYREIFLRGRAGPGASMSARSTDLYTKMYDSPLSCTEGLPIVWARCTSMTGLWNEAETHRLLLHGVRLVDHSKYSFVNKTTTIARGICTEPSINMWMQLGMGSVLEDRIRSVFGIDLSFQPNVNRVLARRGSFGGLSTIDLESASDSMGMKMLREVLPRGMLSMLEFLRCPRTKLPSGELVDLNMVSTMGNGFTFPLQTLLFASVVKTVYHYLDIPMKRDGFVEDRNFGVFGDDIIVETRATPLVLRLLHLLGFVVNTDKTFVEGPFRESCGADYFEGVNVRGVYVKSLKTEQNLFATINALIRWCARFECKLERTIALLLGGVRGPHRRLVPPDEDDSSGIKVPKCCALANNYRQTRNGSIFYQPMVPRNWEFIVIGGCVWTYRGQVSRSYNPAGLFLTFLAGGIRGHRVALRQRVARYTTKRRSTPNWGWFRPRPLEELDVSTSSKRFVDACERNFVNSVFWERV